MEALHVNSIQRINVFISYSSKDGSLKDQLLKHIAVLEHENICCSHDRDIDAGLNWESQVDNLLQNADIILFLVSPNFVASPFCSDVEVRAALARHARAQATVVPVILKPVDCRPLPFGKLNALPSKGIPVTKFRNRDEAFREITIGIRKLAEQHRERLAHGSRQPPDDTKSAQRSQLHREAPNTLRKDSGPGQGTIANFSPASEAMEMKKPEYRYSNLFSIASLTLPYIVLMNSFQNEVHEYRFGDVRISLRTDRPFSLPQAFKTAITAESSEQEGKCRLESIRWIGGSGRPFYLALEFSEVSYRDYLRSGERLDEMIPGTSNKTFRDEYAPDLRSIHDFSRSRLTNICGVGVFLITRDNQLILSRHSDNVQVMGRVLSYSSSGTMDWNPHLHPFLEIIRECEEEIAVTLSSDDLRMFSIGLDAKRQYFQFSFYANISLTAGEVMSAAIQARDFSFEFEHIMPVPFDLETVASLVKDDVWEPAAQSALLTLCAKRYGASAVEQALDQGFVRERYKQSMRAEWARRASRPGDFAVMSDRYPYHEMAQKSIHYANAVMEFIGADVDGKDVVEIGCGIGRLTRQLVQKASRMVCIDLDKSMIERNIESLRGAASKVEYRHCFAQDYQPASKHDVAICSLVLVHNTNDLAFSELTNALKSLADTLFCPSTATHWLARARTRKPGPLRNL